MKLTHAPAVSWPVFLQHCFLQRRDQECYAPVIQVLKFLVNPDIKEGAGLVLAQQGLSAEAVQEAKAVILKVRALCLHALCWHVLHEALGIRALLKLP